MPRSRVFSGPPQPPPPPPPYSDLGVDPQLPGSSNERTPLSRSTGSPPNFQHYNSESRPPIASRPNLGTSGPEQNDTISVTAPSKISHFHIFSYLLIGLVVGYIFTTVVHSATWEFEKNSHEQMRRIWSSEISAHQSLRSRMLEESTAWKNEKIARDAERDQWEKGSEGIAWEGFVRSNKCLRYGTREYTAILTHVPLGFNAMAECSKKSAFINGRELLPTRCEDPGSCGNAIGHWEVEGDVLCRPVWGWIYDKGCDNNAYGKRRFESQLMELRPGDDWHVLCPTTPVEIRGRHISAPDTCADWGLRGIWGIWFVPDDQCR